MNKQELIERIECLKNIFGNKVEYIEIDAAIELVSKLDEPQKVTIPKFVADWIENSKQEKRNLRNALNNGSEKMRLWLLDQENYDLFARAWLDGYEVEEEKRYEVKIKASGQYLAKTKLKEISFMYNGACSHFTRKQLEEADFGWVFDCPGIEIEEVE